jgi:flavin-dependent dehydrogenase
MKQPVTIVGAGPAGLTAAIVLRRHGIPVIVYEMSPEVGHRLNGDFQGIENWTTERDVIDILEEMGIRINFLCIPRYGGTIHIPGRRGSTVSSEKPLFYLVKRGPGEETLDTGLWKQAEALGAEVVFNHRVSEFSASTIVGTGPGTADAIAVGLTFRTDLGDTSAAVFDDSIAPTSYAYLLVHRGFGTMATVLLDDFASRQAYFARMVDFFRQEYRLRISDEKRFTSCASFFLRHGGMRRGGLFVGESAGFQDYLWGFGMRYAFRSGCLAALSILQGHDYNPLWESELKPLLETSIINRWLIEKSGSAGYRYLALRLAGQNPRRFLRRHYNPSFAKHLLLPLVRRQFRSRMDTPTASAPSFTTGGCTEGK